MQPWRKSSRSSSSSNNCVQTAALRGQVAVRDSKDPDGARLRVSADAWKRFARSVR